jgi:hypothetical protein
MSSGMSSMSSDRRDCIWALQVPISGGQKTHLSCRCAAPLTSHHEAAVPRSFVRAAVVFDHADSGLFHVLKDTIRLHNVLTLGIVAPAPLPASPSQPAPEAAPVAQVAAAQSARSRSEGGVAAEVSHTQVVAFQEAVKAGSGEAIAQGDEGAGDAQEAPLPEAVEQLLECSDALDVVALHDLATRQLSEEEAASGELDVLTGCHFTDGRIRIVLVEGPRDGAMAKLIAPVHPRPTPSVYA